MPEFRRPENRSYFENGGVNFAFAGSTITLTWSGTGAATQPQPGERRAVFEIQTSGGGQSVPDGGSSALLLGLSLLGIVRLKKLRSA